MWHYLTYKGIIDSLKDNIKKVFTSQKSFKNKVITLFKEVNIKKKV